MFSFLNCMYLSLLILISYFCFYLFYLFLEFAPFQISTPSRFWPFLWVEYDKKNKILKKKITLAAFFAFSKKMAILYFFQLMTHKTLKITEKWIFYKITIGIGLSSSIEWYPKSKILGGVEICIDANSLISIKIL